MNVPLPIDAALVVYLIGFLLFFRRIKDLAYSIGRFFGVELVDEFFPGYAKHKPDRLRPFLWLLSGPAAGGAVSGLLYLWAGV